MTAEEVLTALKPLGTEQYRKILRNHGVPDPTFGVKIEELKKIQKRVKKDHQLALDLFGTGIYDAMYLAGLIADERQMTQKDLRRWVTKARCEAIAQYPVAWVAAEGPHGWELAREWIDSKDELAQVAGWSTLSSLVSIRDDAELDLPELKRLLKRVERTIHKAPNCVRYVMNGFVIAAGSYVKDLTDLALATGEKIGEVTVDMGDTECKVPFAPDYIRKVEAKGAIGKKRKMARC
jgi:3-methyladenine DNA glycosylase AlkD